jgi:hypothetical protein
MLATLGFYTVIAIVPLTVIVSLYKMYVAYMWTDGYISLTKINVGDVIRKVYCGLESEYIRYYVCAKCIGTDSKMKIIVVPYDELKNKSKNEQYYRIRDAKSTNREDSYYSYAILTRFKL